MQYRLDQMVRGTEFAKLANFAGTKIVIVTVPDLEAFLISRGPRHVPFAKHTDADALERLRPIDQNGRGAGA